MVMMKHTWAGAKFLGGFRLYLHVISFAIDFGVGIMRGREQLWGGDQLPIPTRYKISVWGDQSPAETTNAGVHKVRIKKF